MGNDCDPKYAATFYDRGGQVIPSPSNLTTLSWGRKLDDISRARLTYTISGDNCCDSLGYLEPIVHEVGITRNDELVWYGWLLQPEYSRNTVEIPCVDALWWLTKRRFHNDKTWTNTDLSTIFDDIWQDAVVDADPIRAFTTIDNCGVLESREIRASANRIAWNMVREMLDTGLDITCVGQNVLAGIPFGGIPLQFNLAELQGDPSVIKDGNRFATKIIVDANEKIQAEYPETGWAGSDYYPLIEDVIKDSQIQDQQSALNAAKARYEYTRIIPRLVNLKDGLTLLPGTSISFDQLVPGRRMIVDTKGLCYNAIEEFRLGSIDVDVAGGVETVKLGLQPKGPAGGLEESEDPLV